MKSTPRSHGMSEIVCGRGIFNIHLVDAGNLEHQWATLHAFENANFVAFVIDLASYDQVPTDDGFETQLLETLAYFKRVVSSRSFEKSMFVLFFNNVHIFMSRLKISPLPASWPGCSDGTDAKKAVQDVVDVFKKQDNAPKRIYHRLTQPSDGCNLDFLLKSINDGIVQKKLDQLMEDGLL